MNVRQEIVNTVLRKYAISGTLKPSPVLSGQSHKTTDRVCTIWHWLVPAPWRRVVFADESRFVFYTKDVWVQVHRLSAERHMEQSKHPRVALGGGLLHVWAAFSGEGMCNIDILKHYVNATIYREILEKNMIPRAVGLYGRILGFQDDNILAHRGRVYNGHYAKTCIIHLLYYSISSSVV